MYRWLDVAAGVTVLFTTFLTLVGVWTLGLVAASDVAILASLLVLLGALLIGSAAGISRRVRSDTSYW